MPTFIPSDFWSSAESYYKSKDPYLELLYSTAEREPSEEEKAERQEPETSIFNEKRGWPGEGDKHGEGKGDESSKKIVDEIVSRKMEGLSLGFEDLVKKGVKKGEGKKGGKAKAKG